MREGILQYKNLYYRYGTGLLDIGAPWAAKSYNKSHTGARLRFADYSPGLANRNLRNEFSIWTFGRRQTIENRRFSYTRTDDQNG